MFKIKSRSNVQIVDHPNTLEKIYGTKMLKKSISVILSDVEITLKNKHNINFIQQTF